MKEEINKNAKKEVDKLANTVIEDLRRIFCDWDIISRTHSNIHRRRDKSKYFFFGKNE
ncbi:MAG: hypothetical protein U9P70_03345 [Patescibacteria group bacterium]|nr:hypothetical protein [Patescibacteria group bacterium]